MADEFQTGICSGKWWNSSRRNGSNEASLPCSSSSAINDVGSFGWPSEMMEMKPRSCEDSVSVTDSSIVFQDAQKGQGSDSISGGGSNILMDSTLQMMSYGLSSPTMDWNQASVLSGSGGRAESNFLSMLQEDSSSKPNYHQEMGLESTDIQRVWSPKKFSGVGSPAGCGGDSSTNAFKRINQELITLEQLRLNSSSSSDECTTTCQGLSTSFSMDSVSYGYPSTLFQGLFEPEFQPQQQFPYENQMMNYPSSQSNFLNTNELSPSWPKFPQFLNSSPSTPSKAPLWNAPAASMNNVRSSFFPSSQTRFLTSTFEEKPNCSSNLTGKSKTEEVRDSGSLVKKGSSEPALKRPRIETPSPLPTFKVRKEKLGDRITALQQLVSPFGKTDTASVLYEAIGYINFLHGQVSTLTTPYMKNGASIQHQQNSDKSKATEGPQQDLRSRGLCLVPISSTFAVTNEITADFWMPTFGGTYR